MTEQTQIAANVSELRDKLKIWLPQIPFSLKRRHPKEPGRQKKEKFEDKVYALFRRDFRRQKKIIVEMLQTLSPDRKAAHERSVKFYMDLLGDDLFVDDKFVADLARAFTGGTKESIDIFAASIGLGLDYTPVNEAAAKWASDYSFKLVKGIKNTSRDTLRTVFKSFVETPGMTIGDVVNRLPYNDLRSLRIARTETSRIYSKTEQIAGEALEKEFPGVQVIKRWWTDRNNCKWCDALHGTIIGIKDEFSAKVDGAVLSAPHPPLHVNCDCFTTTTTRIIGDALPEAPGAQEDIVYGSTSDTSLGGVNQSYRVRVGDGEAIIKPGANIWEMEMESEEFAHQLSEELGFNIVPNTTVREAGTYRLPDGSIANVNASVQEWVTDGVLGNDVDWDTIDERSYSRMVLQDSLVNNRDRHLANWMVADGKVVAIDNGLGLREMTGNLFHHSTFIDGAETYLENTGKEKLKFAVADIDAITDLSRNADFRTSFIDTFGQEKWTSFEYQANVLTKNKSSLVKGIDIDFWMEDL